MDKNWEKGDNDTFQACILHVGCFGYEINEISINVWCQMFTQVLCISLDFYKALILVKLHKNSDNPKEGFS